MVIPVITRYSQEGHLGNFYAYRILIMLSLCTCSCYNMSWSSCLYLNLLVIKSLYVFVPVCTLPPPSAEFCSRHNFWTTFWISFIFGMIVGPDLYITWLDFGQFSLWPWPWIFKVKYGICYISAKMVRLPQNKKQTYQLNSRPQMWPMGLTLAMTMNFQGQMWSWPFGDQGQV